MFYTYQWKHTETGKTGTKRKLFASYETFLKTLSEWNRMADGAWVYWEVADTYVPEIPIEHTETNTFRQIM